MPLLHSKILGQGQPLLILHGFLGMGDNWKTLANQFSEHFEVHLIDQRNHGRSFHSDEFSYELMSSDLSEYITHYNLKNCNIIGHSMGGKTAMQFSLNYPDLIDKLIVADIAPKVYPAHHQYILKALQEVNFKEQKSRKEIEEVLKLYIDEFGVIQFLMKNVYRETKTDLAYRFNLEVLSDRYEEVVKSGLPDSIFEKPTLFLKGSKSSYITKADEVLIKKTFNNSKILEISNSGHWLHAENPSEFYTVVMIFLIN
ncbi:MAG: alpha/beta fold hydrolase [Flavobacteriaceae bacterium]|nr:alpha/beta fold hydrolase [Flavobacteriaceae bacterium]